MPCPHSKPKLSALLASGTPIVLDGALATYLETLGADISGALWSAQILLSQSALIRRTHLDYFQSGANIAITSSYQASIPGLTKHLRISEAEAKRLVIKSVELAKQARDEFHFSPNGKRLRDANFGTNAYGGVLLVAGSVGPYGAFLADGSEYRGDYVVGNEEMKGFHRGRIAALVEAGVDLLAIETIPSFSETRAIVELLVSEFPDTEAWFSFTLHDATHISDGTPLDEVVKVLEACKNVVAVGVNCVKEDVALGALTELKRLTHKPLVVYPNSGEDWNAQKRDWEGKRSEGSHLAERTKQYWDAGARLIGGCCRTTPSDISIVADTLRKITR